MLQKTINALKNAQQPVAAPQQAPAIDEAALRQILDRLAQLEAALDNLSNEFAKWVKEI